VQSLLAGEPQPARTIEARIAVPSGIADVRRQDPENARQVQASVAEQFDRHFRLVLAVIGFQVTEEAGVYLLGRWDSD
jgi:hypothetical protein